ISRGLSDSRQFGPNAVSLKRTLRHLAGGVARPHSWLPASVARFTFEAIMQRPARPLKHPRLEAMHRRTVLALLSMGLWPSLASARSDVYTRRVLVTHDGKQTSLAAQANGWHLVVVVMKGHWCRVCVAQLERLAELSATLKSLTARVVGLNADAPESNRQLVEDEGSAP